MKAGTHKLHGNSEATLKLLMYRSMPATDKAWLAGFEAAQSNLHLENNPYNDEEAEYKSWENGWWEGFYGEDYSAAELVDELEAWLIAARSKQHPHKNNQIVTPVKSQVNTKKILYLTMIVLATAFGFSLYLNI